MEAKELRTGNWVQVFGKIQQVVDVLCDSINTFEEQSIPYEHVSRIVIEDGILKQCGFTRPHNGLLELNGFIIWSGHFGYMVRYNEVDIIHPRELLGLHELQNLYYALTNTELTINL